ncbi:hypothetical protein [Halobellus captivus]|uniref:hypothetical protein n=1 Tax=Halobellus captivus TaxID=2592614 RepID=UPI00139698E5|nr:hypothetical protein [Halobellus captivus]
MANEALYEIRLGEITEIAAVGNPNCVASSTESLDGHGDVLPEIAVFDDVVHIEVVLRNRNETGTTVVPKFLHSCRVTIPYDKTISRSASNEETTRLAESSFESRGDADRIDRDEWGSV